MMACGISRLSRMVAGIVNSKKESKVAMFNSLALQLAEKRSAKTTAM